MVLTRDSWNGRELEGELMNRLLEEAKDIDGN